MNIKRFSSVTAITCCLACGGEASDSPASSEPANEAPASAAPPVQPTPTTPTPLGPGTEQTPGPAEPIASPGASIAPTIAPVEPGAAPTTPPPSATAPVPPAQAPATPDASSNPTPPVQPPAAGTGTTDPAPTPSDGFQLLWEDAFDALDPARWAAQTHSWDGNLAQFTRDNVSVLDGKLQLSLTPSGNADKPYDGVEYRSVDTLTYGKVEASMRFAKGSGVVSSLVLIYTPWPPDDWNELDIECLGNTTGEVQFNHMVNIPPADPATEHLQFPELIDMGFDPTASFHTYTIEWLPNSVRFLVDGVVVHQPTEEISRLVLPQNILLTIWASDAPGWAGPIDDTTAPTVAEVDWIRVYSYAGQ